MKFKYVLICLFYIIIANNTTNAQEKNIPSRYAHITDSLVLYDSLFFHYRFSNLNEAMQYIQRGYTIAHNNKDTNYIARFANMIGIVYKNISKYDSALTYYDEAILIDSVRGDIENFSAHIANKGFVYKLKGEYVEALEAYFKALDLIKDDNAKITISILNNIGNIYADQFDYNQALNYYIQAKSLADKNNIKNAIGYAYNNIGNVYIEKKEYDKALLHFDTSLIFKHDINDTRGIASSLGNIGRVYLAQNEIDTAENYFQQARIIYEALDDKSGQAEVYLHLGDVAVAKQNDAEVIMFYEKCLNTSQEIGTKPIKLHLYKHLSVYYASRNQYEKAFIYSSEYNNLRDSLQTIEHIKQINNLKHEAEQKESKQAIESLQQRNEIQKLQNKQQKNLQYFLLGSLILAAALLIMAFFFYQSKQRHNIILAQMNTEISSALSHRELLLREIHHRVKNNLQIVASLLNLQRGNKQTPENILQQSQERVYTMSILHELLYQSKHLDVIELDDYVQSLFAQLRQAYKKVEQINISINIEPIQFNIDILTPCGLIINEIITNIFKYAFPIEQNISDPYIKIIGTRVNTNQYKLSIADNGVGLPQDFDIQRSRSLGLRLVQGLSKQINANLIISPRNPTCFDIYIPL